MAWPCGHGHRKLWRAAASPAWRRPAARGWGNPFVMFPEILLKNNPRCSCVLFVEKHRKNHESRQRSESEFHTFYIRDTVDKIIYRPCTAHRSAMFFDYSEHGLVSHDCRAYGTGTIVLFLGRAARSRSRRGARWTRLPPACRQDLEHLLLACCHGRTASPRGGDE